MEKTIVARNIQLVELNLLILLSQPIFGVDPIQSLIVIMEFMIIRAFREPLHYDKIYKCLFMTLALIGSIFIVLKIDFILAILVTFVAGIVSSEPSENIKDNVNNLMSRIIEEGFIYKPRGDTKYQVIDQYIKQNPDSPILKDFETDLRKYGGDKIYSIYKSRFCEYAENGQHLSLEIIEQRIGINQRRIVEYLDIILICFKIYLKIK